MSGVWVFGYGSLVSPPSFGATLGRELRWGVDLFEAEIEGYGRRWNYGVMHSTGFAVAPDGSETERTIVALGVVASGAETVNGVVGWVSDVELVALDRRERHYDRVDVSATTSVSGEISGPIVTYVPRREAIEHYERARDAGRAVIEQRYWDLVDTAFADLGPDHHRRYHASTPAPDVPVLPVRRG
jgi:cation transport regulator ChaC